MVIDVQKINLIIILLSPNRGAGIAHTGRPWPSEQQAPHPKPLPHSWAWTKKEKTILSLSMTSAC